MQLLNSYAEFEAWKEHNISAVDVAEEPREFPCYVRTVVTDWGMQQEAAIYTYAGDLRKMLGELNGADHVHQLLKQHEEDVQQMTRLAHERQKWVVMVNRLAHIILQKEITDNDRDEAEEALEKVLPLL